MDERKKVTLLTTAVGILLVIAVVIGFRTLTGTAEPTVSAAYRDMDPKQRQTLEFDMERKRRKYGKPAILHLPEDPPGFPPREGAAPANAAPGNSYGGRR